ncbi:PIG-L deacetylase family protein [Thermodesulfobacteriota bacterium]
MNILAVGAHYDDVELGCSGTLINHVKKGDRVTIIVVTDSAYKDPNGTMIRSADIAKEEGIKAADIIGADLICLEYETFFVPFDERLTKTITSYIEDLNIDTVYCHWVHDLHRDHQYVAKSTIMASRHVPRVLMYRSNYYDTYDTFRGKFYSDISKVMDSKIEVIKAHQSELERVRHEWITFITRQNANDGQKNHLKYAECFEIIRYVI